MAVIAVLAGTVEVRVTNVPRWFLLGWKGTVTIKRNDFVGLRVADAIERVIQMDRWRLTSSYILNGKRLTPEELNTTFLKRDDKLELEDP